MTKEEQVLIRISALATKTDEASIEELRVLNLMLSRETLSQDEIDRLAYEEGIFVI